MQLTYARVVAVATILVMMAIAGLGYLSTYYNLEALRRASLETIAWSATQLESELVRFNLSLSNFQMQPDDDGVGNVQERFDILWSRAAIFEHGSVGERLRAYDTEDHSVDRLLQELRFSEAEVVGLKAGDTAAAHAVMERFITLVPEMKLLSNRVILGEEAARGDMREQVRRGTALTGMLSFAAVVLSLVALARIWREGQRYRVLAEANRQLATAAEAANRAKSRFLTMMSHELRTPMNGVLGLLALARQHGLAPPQLRLVEQAERSGQQMIGMLSDILDFSAMQDDQLQLDNKPFEPRQLALAITDLFEPLARREGIAFRVRADDSLPLRVTGDFRRLRQAIAHIAAYIVETAGTRDIVLDLTWSAGELVTTVSYDYADRDGEWRPDLILGAPDRTSEQFASDALGPAVARGLIQRMGGTIRLDSPPGGRIAIVISAPAAPFEPEFMGVAMDMRSAAMEAICRSALRSDKVRFHREGEAKPVHVVLVEAGGEDENRRVQAMRARHPGAMLVAIGRPNNVEEFDARVDLPLDIDLLRGSVLQQLAS